MGPIFLRLSVVEAPAPVFVWRWRWTPTHWFIHRLAYFSNVKLQWFYHYACCWHIFIERYSHNAVSCAMNPPEMLQYNVVSLDDGVNLWLCKEIKLRSPQSQHLCQSVSCGSSLCVLVFIFLILSCWSHAVCGPYLENHSHWNHKQSGAGLNFSWSLRTDCFVPSAGFMPDADGL